MREQQMFAFRGKWLTVVPLLPTPSACRFEFPCWTNAISTIIDTIQQHSTMRILVGIDLVGKGKLQSPSFAL